MTPAIKLLLNAGIPYQIHKYEHDPASESYGLEAAEKLAVDPARVYKTLVVCTDEKQWVVGLVPVVAMLDLKAIAKAVGVKKAAMAAASDAERATGYILGAISPLGQKRRLKTVIDSSASNHSSIYISAGRRGLEIELAPDELRRLAAGVYAEIAH